MGLMALKPNLAREPWRAVHRIPLGELWVPGEEARKRCWST